MVIERRKHSTEGNQRHCREHDHQCVEISTCTIKKKKHTFLAKLYIWAIKIVLNCLEILGIRDISKLMHINTPKIYKAHNWIFCYMDYGNSSRVRVCDWRSIHLIPFPRTRECEKNKQISWYTLLFLGQNVEYNMRHFRHNTRVSCKDIW